jgi:hypothetical protein
LDGVDEFSAVNTNTLIGLQEWSSLEIAGVFLSQLFSS